MGRRGLVEGVWEGGAYLQIVCPLEPGLQGGSPACHWADTSSQYRHAFHKLFIDLASHQDLCWGLGARLE